MKRLLAVLFALTLASPSWAGVVYMLGEGAVAWDGGSKLTHTTGGTPPTDQWDEIELDPTDGAMFHFFVPSDLTNNTVLIALGFRDDTATGQFCYRVHICAWTGDSTANCDTSSGANGEGVGAIALTTTSASEELGLTLATPTLTESDVSNSLCTGTDCVGFAARVLVVRDNTIGGSCTSPNAADPIFLRYVVVNYS